MKLIKNPRSFLIVGLLVYFSTTYSTTSNAHEFWIEPLLPTAPLDKKISAHGRVGQKFKGEALYYIPSSIQKVFIAHNTGITKISRTIGDFPIFDQAVKSSGLHILSYQSRATKIKYKSIEKFKKFLDEVGLNAILKQHLAQGFPQKGFSETYTRYAKALVNRGTPSGSDKVVGFPIEIIAQQNPYLLKSNNATTNMSALLLWNGKPLSNAQISIFEKPAQKKSGAQVSAENKSQVEDATITKHLTNPNGLITFPIKPNKTYLLNAVQIIPGTSTSNIIWQSLWASLTFTTNK